MSAPKRSEQVARRIEKIARWFEGKPDHHQSLIVVGLLVLLGLVIWKASVIFWCGIIFAVIYLIGYRMRHPKPPKIIIQKEY